MARPRKATKVLSSLDGCTAAMGELLSVTTQMETLVADRDLRVAETQAEYEPAIDEARKRAADLTEQLKTYYMTHLVEIEKAGRKSVQLATGVMGRRLTPKKLALLNRSWSWEAVLNALKTKFAEKFLRAREPEIDKDMVKTELAPEQMHEIGLKLTQDEEFYVELARLPGAEVRAL